MIHSSLFCRAPYIHFGVRMFVLRFLIQPFFLFWRRQPLEGFNRKITAVRFRL